MENNTQETPKFDYKTLSLKKQYVWKFCKQILRDLKNGDCTDEQIDEIIASTSPKSHGYFREEDFVNSDQAMRILGVGQNRNKFFDLLKVYKIKSNTFNGMKIGYRKDEINALAARLQRNKR